MDTGKLFFLFLVFVIVIAIVSVYYYNIMSTDTILLYYRVFKEKLKTLKFENCPCDFHMLESENEVPKIKSLYKEVWEEYPKDLHLDEPKSLNHQFYFNEYINHMDKDGNFKFMVVATINSEPVGFIGVKDTCTLSRTICNFGVSPAHRNKNIGGSLLEIIEKELYFNKSGLVRVRVNDTSQVIDFSNGKINLFNRKKYAAIGEF